MKAAVIILTLFAALMGGKLLLRQQPSTAFHKEAKKSLQLSSREEIREAPEIPPLPIEDFTWVKIESADYKEYIANLRAIGCPEETIRDIIIAEINKLYEPREAPFKPEAQKAPFPWERMVSTGFPTLSSTALRQAEFEKRKALRNIHIEKNAVIKELLDLTLPLETLQARDSRNYSDFEAAFAALPIEKRQLVQDIQERYWQSSDSLKDRHTNSQNSAYLEDYKQINIDRRNALAQVLSPREMEDYEMRTSNLHSQLQSQLAGLNPTEEEYRGIFKTLKPLTEPYIGNLPGIPEPEKAGGLDPEYEAKKQLQKILGEERFAEYERLQDWGYQNLRRVSTRYELSQESTMKAYELQRGARDKIRQLQRDQTLDDQARRAARNEIAQEVERNLQQTLGERAFKAYQRRGISY